MQVEGENSVIAGSSAMTEVKERSISVNLYDAYLGEATFAELQVRVQAMTHANIVGNNDIELDVGGLTEIADGMAWGGIDWSSVIEKGIGGAIIGGVIAAVLGILRRWRRS